MSGLAGATPSPPAVVAASAAVTSLRTRIAAQHAAGAPGVPTSGLATDLFERVVLDVWEAALASLPSTVSADVRRSVALVALGGFGRREMAPFSAVDCMAIMVLPPGAMMAPRMKSAWPPMPL